MQSFLNVLYEQALLLFPKILSSLFIYIGFWIGGTILKVVIIKAASHSRVDNHLIELLANFAKIVVLVFGAVTALGTIGVNVGALIAGLGLSSFVLGFAFKDALSNIMAGIFILFYRPFVAGDKVAITGFEGKVARIDMRYTTLSAADKTILIPNSNIFTNPVTIFKAGETPK